MEGGASFIEVCQLWYINYLHTSENVQPIGKNEKKYWKNTPIKHTEWDIIHTKKYNLGTADQKKKCWKKHNLFITFFLDFSMIIQLWHAKSGI